jgi:hypothetical protein
MIINRNSALPSLLVVFAIEMVAILLALYFFGCAHPLAGTPDATANAQQAMTQDPAVPWPMHVIHAGLRGADGVDLAVINGELAITTPWEEDGKVTVSYFPGLAGITAPWPTTVVSTTTIKGAEDSIFADVDGDGRLDVVAASENQVIAIYFANADGTWTEVKIAAATNLQRWMQVAFADIDGDGKGDIIAGGKTSPASIGWFTAPANPRSSAGWTYHVIGEVGWLMSLIAGDEDGDGDIDLTVSDRRYIRNANGSINYTLRGSRRLENLGSGASWANHPIGFAGMEHKFSDLVDLDGDGVKEVVDGAGTETTTAITLRTFLAATGAWSGVAIPTPAGVGMYQDNAAGDIDGDGVKDLVFSFSAAPGSLSGVVWQDLATGTRHEVAGSPGVKFDEVRLYDVEPDGDLDIITTEQSEDTDGNGAVGPGLGLILYTNPSVP